MATNKDELVMRGVLSQLTVQKLDYEKLATTIGVGTPKAAWHRWDKFKKNPGTGNEKLLQGVLEQVGVGKINYEKLAEDIGAGTPKAAWHRWDKLKKKMGVVSTTPRKTVGTPRKSRAKKVEKKDVKVEGDEDSGMVGDNEGDDMDVDVDEPETPTRTQKLPVREKVCDFKMQTQMFTDTCAKADDGFIDMEGDGFMKEES